jgi:outer membrane protein OmpA-like peptidoglycan-associated protein
MTPKLKCAALALAILPSWVFAQGTTVIREGEVDEEALIKRLYNPDPRSIHSEREPQSVSLLITFITNSAELTPQAKRSLDVVGLALNSGQLSEFKFAIEGHADPRGDPEANLRLSQARADAVRDYLVKRTNVVENRLVAEGKGDREPLNKKNPAAPENRRVTIINLGETASAGR